MKRNKLVLALLAAACFTVKVYGQATIDVEAPYWNTYSQDVAPSGYYSYARGCFLITAAELTALTGSGINSFGFDVYNGTSGNPVGGNITVRLQNTSDTYYSKGTNFTSAISGMSTVYNGNMTIPSYNGGSSTIMLNLPSPFNYTGGGIYVCYSWSITSTPDNTGAYYLANSSNSSYMGAYTNYNSNSLSTSATRPVCRFNVTNTATNEAGVLSIIAPGTVAEAIHDPHTITADIINKSVNTLNNVNVSLNVNGANNFTDNQVITSIAPGAIQTVTFLPFNPTSLGTNTIYVSLPADQNQANNNFATTQSVTCNESGNIPPVGIFNNGLGFENGGIFCSVFNYGTPTSLTGVRLGISNDYSSVSMPVYGVLMDQNGTILATTNTVTVNSNMLGTFQTFTFSQNQPLLAYADYYIGMAQPGPNYYPMGVLSIFQFNDNRFFDTSINGGAFSPDDNFGYFAIDPLLAGPNITVTQASTVICLGESITLTAGGATSYTWTGSVFDPIDTPNAPTITVSPTGNELYALAGIDAAGCSGSTTAPVAVKLCTGLSVNLLAAEIKLYPNPSENNKTVISGLQGTTTISVYNMLGALVLIKSTSDEKFVVDLAGQAQGNYLVKITDADNHSKTVKFVNQN